MKIFAIPITWQRNEIVLAVGLWLSVSVCLAITAWASVWFKIPSGRFTRDPLQIFHGKPWEGMLSNLGVVMWCAAAFVCLFSYAVLRHSNADHPTKRFLLSCGALSTLLMLDDLYLFHERIFPMLFGVNELVIFGAYAVIAAFVIWRDRNILAQSNGLLIAALLFFAVSIGMDILPLKLGEWQHLVEDGLKILGIVSWSGFFFAFCLRTVRQYLGTGSV